MAGRHQMSPQELEQRWLRRDSVNQMMLALKARNAAIAIVPVSEQVARINSRLVGEAVSDEALIESLRKLKAVPMTYETLDATKIGQTLLVLRRHASEQVRQLAVSLFNSWKPLVEEHFGVCLSIPTTSSTPAVGEGAPLPGPTSKPSSSNQETATPASRETPKDAAKRKEAPLSISDDDAKMARTKRRIHEAYESAAAMKKQRRIQIIDEPAGEYSCPA